MWQVGQRIIGKHGITPDTIEDAAWMFLLLRAVEDTMWFHPGYGTAEAIDRVRTLLTGYFAETTDYTLLRKHFERGVNAFAYWPGNNADHEQMLYEHQEFVDAMARLFQKLGIPFSQPPCGDDYPGWVDFFADVNLYEELGVDDRDDDGDAELPVERTLHVVRR